MQVLTPRALEELPATFGVSSVRRSRRPAPPPPRSLGYFSTTAAPSRPRSRAGNHSRSDSITSPSSDSSVLSASRSSAEFCALPARPAPVLPQLPDLLLPESESEPLTEPEDDPRPRVSVLNQRSCAVEGDDFRAGESVVRLPCGHVFHRDCIIPFVFRARYGGYCPLDGTPVPRVHAALLPVWAIPYPPANASSTPTAHLSSSPTSPKLVISAPPPPPPTSPPPPADVQPEPPAPKSATPEKWVPSYRQACAIDSARFTPGDSCVRLRSCGHVFHARCATAYLAREHHPCCPLDGRSVGPTDIEPVFVQAASRGLSRDGRPSRTSEPRARDARVRRALRALIRAAAATSEVAQQEADAALHVRSTCSLERAASVRRRRRALGDPPAAPDVPFDACAADGERFTNADDVVALPCGHALHARCAHHGCACEDGPPPGDATAGAARELLALLADGDARRWRCAELAALAREKTRVRALDAAGDTRGALAVAERAAAEVRASLKVRRTALAGPPASRFAQDPDRRCSLPDQPSLAARAASNSYRGDSSTRPRRLIEGSGLRRGSSFARLPLPRALRGGSRGASPSNSSTPGTPVAPGALRMSSTLSEPSVLAAQAWARRTGRSRDAEEQSETSERAHSDVPVGVVGRAPFSMFLAPDAPVVIREPSSFRSRSERRRARSGSTSSDGQPGIARVESVLGRAMVGDVGVDDSLRPSSEREHGIDVCVIDLEEFKSGDVLVRLPCMHMFHKDCIVPYLKQQDDPSCPIDRASVDRDEIDELPVWEKK